MVTFCKFEVHTQKQLSKKQKHGAFQCIWDTLIAHQEGFKEEDQAGNGKEWWRAHGCDKNWDCWVEQWQFYGTLIQQKEKDNAF